jgi:hypothetical protein
MRGSIPGWENVFLSTASNLAVGPTKPATRLIPVSLFQRFVRYVSVADHSNSSSAVVKNDGDIFPLLYMSL